jgi:hypothetical protein
MIVLPPIDVVNISCEGVTYIVFKTVADQFKVKKGQEVTRETLVKLGVNMDTRVKLIVDSVLFQN